MPMAPDINDPEKKKYLISSRYRIITKFHFRFHTKISTRPLELFFIKLTFANFLPF